jgi:crotonobetainyl-CoA:carnitine CoA-transferase CaiB-like acyl-CoA transferase
MTSRMAAPMRHTPASKALAKYKVLDLTRARAGPTAARQLADWGAQVIKIEMPGSDDTPDFMDRHSPDFQNLHRNKRSMTLNLKSPEGLDIFKQLARHADVIVENYRPDVKHRLGIDYAAIKAIVRDHRVAIRGRRRARRSLSLSSRISLWTQSHLSAIKRPSV